jgi:anti-sigma factor RsiW
MNTRPITEDDLHAYLDHALDGARQAEVETWLETQPEARARIELYRRQRDGLRAALLPVAEEPIPPGLNLRFLAEERRRRYRLDWRSLAAGVVLLVVGASGGWMMRGLMAAPPGGIAAVAQEAADAHRVYGDEHGHAVEVRADERTQLADWVDRSLGHKVMIPDLAPSGYRLMGGRVVPTSQGAAAMFMYDDDHGTRLTMLVRPMAKDGDVPMAEYTMGKMSGYAWADGGMGYSVVGDMPGDALHPLAAKVRQQATGT